MHLATIDRHGTDVLVLVDPDRGVVPLSGLTDDAPPTPARAARGRPA